MLLAVILAGCRGGGSTATTGAVNKITGTPFGTPAFAAHTAEPAGPPPKPASVDTSKIQYIDEWRSYNVPRYDNAPRADYQQQSSADIPSAGTMLYTTSDSPAQVLAFYRGALPKLGWKEQSANSIELTERRDSGGVLVVSATVAQGQTNILLMLTE